MPTISQLPPAAAVSASDTIPISQGGTARSASVATILSSAQPVITVASPSLVGRASLGSGGSEQIGIGQGLILSNTTLVADGLDHSSYPVATNFDIDSDLVISAQGQPMIMPASLLRGLFTAGQNISIAPTGAISANAVGANSVTVGLGNAIGALEAITSLSAQDLVAVSDAGLDRSITYANLLNGLTIDKAQAAVLASDTDTIWSAQGSNILARQNLGAIWTWISGKIPIYKTPVVEITSNTNLNASSHNAHILICSQAITLTPVVASMGNGFVCTIINGSTGNITLDTGFVTSNGSKILSPWQSATIFCLTYSGGNIPFASVSAAASSSMALPGQVLNVAGRTSGATSITVTWMAPTSGGPISSYLLQYRISGSTSWTSCPAIIGLLTYQVTNLQAAISYDVMVQALNATGTGPASAILTLAA